MKVKIVFYHVFHEIDPTVFPERMEAEAIINQNTTLQQLLDVVGQPIADLSEYYYLSGAFSFNSKYLPFLINSSGTIEWDVSFENAKVIDFINTHNIKNDTIISKIGYPQAGGPGFKDFLDIWNLVYPIIDQFVTVIGLGAIFINSGKWVHSLFNKKDIPPQSYFDLVFSKEKWNHFELAELVDIKPQEAQKLLQLFGYKYNNSMLLYVQQPISRELREKLSKINVLDI